MDNKPLLQERPPAYSPAAQGAGYDYGQSNYGAIPAPQPGFQPPPPYPYPGAAAAAGYAVPPPTSQPTYSSTYTIIQQPATTTSVVVVGGCPACRWMQCRQPRTPRGGCMDGLLQSRTSSAGTLVASLQISCHPGSLDFRKSAHCIQV